MLLAQDTAKQQQNDTRQIGRQSSLVQRRHETPGMHIHWPVNEQSFVISDGEPSLYIGNRAYATRGPYAHNTLNPV